MSFGLSHVPRGTLLSSTSKGGARGRATAFGTPPLVRKEPSDNALSNSARTKTRSERPPPPVLHRSPLLVGPCPPEEESEMCGLLFRNSPEGHNAPLLRTLRTLHPIRPPAHVLRLAFRPVQRTTVPHIPPECTSYFHQANHEHCCPEQTWLARTTEVDHDPSLSGTA